jgi:uncharacterized damage-inducible protein DinB
MQLYAVASPLKFKRERPLTGKKRTNNILTISKRRWFDRKFSFDLEIRAFPLIVERLRGTPARIEARIADLAPEQLTWKLESSWSIQENIGHLADLEPLWAGRLDDILSGAEGLRAADLSNELTHNADHNSRGIEEIIRTFRKYREELVVRLDSLDETEVSLSALHPRLRQPMRTLDMAYFVAEHDDHHMARVSEILQSL